MFDKNLIQTNIDNFKVMSHPEDFFFHLLLINYSRSKKILELGAGSGAWAIAINHFLPQIEFLLIENFRYVQKGFNPPYFWPATEKELDDYLNKNNLKYQLFNINAADTHLLDLSNTSIIRWDCDFPNMKENILKVIDKCDDDVIIIVDDIRPNYCLHRLIAMIDLVRDGILSPLWFGIEEGAFVKKDFNKEKIFCELEKYSDKFTYFEKVKNTFVGTEWDYIRTQNIQFFLTN